MFDFDFGLGDEIDMLREAVRDFANDRIAPRAQEIDAANQFPRDLWPQLGELGLLGITVEEADGGQPRIGVRRSVLWRAFQSLPQPVATLGYRCAEGRIPAETDFRRTCRRAGNE